jgi:hypothetical protein
MNVIIHVNISLSEHLQVRRLPPSPDADGLAEELEALRRSLAGRAATY